MPATPLEKFEDEIAHRENLLRKLLWALFYRPRLRQLLLILSNLVINAVAARCIAELIHSVESIGDEEQCYAIDNFLKLAGIVFAIVSVLSLKEVHAITASYNPPTFDQSGCRCRLCSHLLWNVLSGLGPATAAGAALTGSIHTAQDLYDHQPCGEFTAAAIVPGILAGCYVWLYQSLNNSQQLERLERTAPKSTMMFKNIGYILKHLPIMSPLFAQQLGDIFTKETEGTFKRQDIVIDVLWCLAFVFMLCVMGFASQGIRDYRQLPSGEKRALLSTQSVLAHAPAIVDLPSSWPRFFIALLGAGSLGYMAAHQVAYPFVRKGDIDSPRFPAEYDPAVFYGLSSFMTLLVIGHYTFRFYLGLQGFRSSSNRRDSLLNG